MPANLQLLRCRRDVKLVNCAGEALAPHVAGCCSRFSTMLLLVEAARHAGGEPSRSGGGRFASALDRAGVL